MPNTLIFPKGVQLARPDEFLGLSKPELEAAWARIQSANIAPGFVLRRSNDPQFALYVEANVDAPRIWAVFYDLCRALLGSTAAFIIGQIDNEPVSVGVASTGSILSLLERHQFQLVNDGFVQFGLVDQRKELINEVFLAPTKHFKVWGNDAERLRAVFATHGVPEVERLEFLDQYPRTTVVLSGEKILFRPDELIGHLKQELGQIQAS